MQLTRLKMADEGLRDGEAAIQVTLETLYSFTSKKSTYIAFEEPKIKQIKVIYNTHLVFQI